MRKDYIPKRDEEFLNWLKNFNQVAQDHLDDLHLEQEEINPARDGFDDLSVALDEEAKASLRTKSATREIERARENARIMAVKLAGRALNADIPYSVKSRLGVIVNAPKIDLKFQATSLSGRWDKPEERTAPDQTDYFVTTGQEVKLSWETAPAECHVSLHKEVAGTSSAVLASGKSVGSNGSWSGVPTGETTYVLTVTEPNTTQERVEKLVVHVLRPPLKRPVIEKFELLPGTAAWLYHPRTEQVNGGVERRYYVARDQEVSLSWKVSPEDSLVGLQARSGGGEPFIDLIDPPADASGSLVIQPNAHAATYLLHAQNPEDPSLDARATVVVMVPPSAPINLRVTTTYQSRNVLYWELAETSADVVFLVEVAFGADVEVEQTGRGGAIKAKALRWTPLIDEGNDYSTKELTFVHPFVAKRGLFGLKVVRAIYRVRARCGDLDGPYSAEVVVECK